MLQTKNITVALVGNPNAGKSSLFNHLTGLNQKVGNFPGVTVDKKTGITRLDSLTLATVIDLPGTYSLYPKSPDEQVALNVLSNPESKLYPDIVVVVADASNLKRNLLLFTQIADLGLPVVLALNMLDVAAEAGLQINIPLLSRQLGVEIVPINGRKGEGLPELKKALLKPIKASIAPFFDAEALAPVVVSQIRSTFKLPTDYQALQWAQQYNQLDRLTAQDKSFIDELNQKNGFDKMAAQANETIQRYQTLNNLLTGVVTNKQLSVTKHWLSLADRILTHRIGGFVIFLAILFLIFQAVFAWASYPMDWIDAGIASLNDYLKAILPTGAFTDLITEGLVAGLGGILIFVPQIALLFAFIAILEESGYMARVMYIMDRLMRKFGLNGKSIVPLISGVACAVPAIMAARNIDNRKERLITIFVTPLMSCSARIPVYTILIALVVPDSQVGGIFNLQGIALMAMYLIGFLAAIFSAYLMKHIMKSKERSFFIMELPVYKMPRWKNVGLTIVEKVKAFVWEAGRIIVAISIVLWVLASYGPGEAMENTEHTVKMSHPQASPAQLDNLVAAQQLEASYAGHFGKLIEPAIRPLGFDWKIGIALITSFAAREVFIGTMATIYSIGNESDNEATVKERMAAEINPVTGKPLYGPALGFSLLVFYLFAMQCMSTLATVYRETRSWRWPLLQLAYMSGLAYFSALLVYQVLK